MTKQTYTPLTDEQLGMISEFAAAYDNGQIFGDEVMEAIGDDIPALIAAARHAEALAAALEASLDAMTIELNPSNYDHDDACRLNDDMTQVHSIITAALSAYRGAGS